MRGSGRGRGKEERQREIANEPSEHLQLFSGKQTLGESHSPRPHRMAGPQTRQQLPGCRQARFHLTDSNMGHTNRLATK